MLLDKIARKLSRHMVGNRYHNVIMMLGFLALLLIALVASSTYDLPATALRMCAGCPLP
jgi:hypothetical protein